MIKSIHHVSILTADLQRSLEFYVRVLGLELSGKRPDLGFDGAWLNLGSQQLHLIVQNETGKADSGRRCGQDHHVAFNTDDLSSIKDRLSKAGVAFESSRSGRPAIFCRDPDGNALEFIGGN